MKENKEANIADQEGNTNEFDSDDDFGLGADEMDSYNYGFEGGGDDDFDDDVSLTDIE